MLNILEPKNVGKLLYLFNNYFHEPWAVKTFVILFYECWIRNGICLTIACCRLLDQIVKNLGHLEDIYPVIKQLGGRHGTRGYDVPVKHMAVSLTRVFATKLQLLYFFLLF